MLGLVQDLNQGLVDQVENHGAPVVDGLSSIRFGYKGIYSFLIDSRCQRSSSSHYQAGANNRDDWIVCGGTKGVSLAGISKDWWPRQQGKRKW